ncbi:phage holin family protein [Bartonella sp. B17]
MYKLVALISNHLFDRELKSTIKQVRLQAICYGIVGTSMLISLIFLCVIGFIALCLVTTPLAAASIMFFIWLFIAAFGVIVGRVIKAHQRYYQQKKLEEQRQKLIAEATLFSIAALSKHVSFAKLSIPVLGLMAYFLWKKDKKSHF